MIFLLLKNRGLRLRLFVGLLLVMGSLPEGIAGAGAGVAGAGDGKEAGGTGVGEAGVGAGMEAGTGAVRGGRHARAATKCLQCKVPHDGSCPKTESVECKTGICFQSDGKGPGAKMTPIHSKGCETLTKGGHDKEFTCKTITEFDQPVKYCRCNDKDDCNNAGSPAGRSTPHGNLIFAILMTPAIYSFIRGMSAF